MSVVIRLMRAGAKKRPFYRMVVADSRRQRDGRFIEILGHYDPIAKPHTLKVDQAAVEQWIAKGARPSEQVASLLRSLNIKLSAPKTGPLQPKKTEAAAAPAKKAARKRAVKRTVSERKTKKKVAKKSGKKVAKKSAAKK